MPIHSDAPASSESSSFYLRHRDYAHAWEAFANEFGAEIEGKYNAYYVDVSLFGELAKQRFQLHGNRELKSVTMGIIPLKAVYVELSRFLIQLPNMNHQSFIVQKNKLFRRMMGFKAFGKQKHFVWKTKDESAFSEMPEKNELEAFFIKSKLHSMEYTSSGKLKLRFFSFFPSEAALQELMYGLKHLTSYLNSVYNI